ncbi:MAG: DUF4091 domain-containing protein [bacterium]|nr:DUF4091 domain-containing protein [bacterium]
MNLRKRMSALLALILSLISTAAFSLEPELFVVSSLAKAPSGLPDTAFLAHFETRPLIHAAWGESEAVQILICTGDSELSNLHVELGEFTQETGDYLEEEALSAGFVGFVTTEEPYYGTLHVGEWADPILPDLQVDVPAGRTQAIWVEVAVPLAAEAGHYTGEVRLSADDWNAVVEMEIEVWGFDLPESPTLASSFMLYPKYVYQYHNLEKGTPAADAMMQRYHESMLAHRIMPAHVAVGAVGTRPELRISNEGELKRADFTAFDNQVEWAMERGQTLFCLEGPRKVNVWTEAWYRAVGEHLAEKRWLDIFYTYLFDETYEGVREMTAMVGRAAPGLRNLITRLPADGYPDVHWWCPRLGDALMQAATVDPWLAARGQGREDLWVYTAGNAGSDVPALHLDVPGLEARHTAPAVWIEGYAGLLFWCVNYWTVDPWEDPMVYPRQNGNGALYYPGPDGPVESIRLKMLRDGFDDVDYAHLLQHADEDLADKLFDLMPLSGALNRDSDPLALQSWRLAAGYYLSGNETLADSWVAEQERIAANSLQGVIEATNSDKPKRGWHGGRDVKAVEQADGKTLQFTLDAGKDKLWRMPMPSDWQAFREVIIDLRLMEGEPVRLGFKLGSGLIKRKVWTWEIHLAPGEQRRVRIPIPHERVDTSSLKEAAFFLWEPESARRFEMSGMWLR